MTEVASDEPGRAARSWPAVRDLSRLPPAAIFACFILAGIVVAVDLIVSSRYGLLARPPMHDGLGYLQGAKLLYYIREPSFLGALSGNWAFFHAPLWVALMSASFFVFGEGEWQSHFVRVWPLFLLLLLVFWFVRRRWCSGAAWFAVGITATLPTAFPALAACARGWGSEANGYTYYLGDPRPDFLAAVLLVWAVVLILDNIQSPKRVYFVCSGLALGLACLTKPSGMPAYILIWGLVWMYLMAANRRNLRRVAADCGLSTFVAAAMVIPYLWLGGYQHITKYVWDALVTHRAIWSTASTPLGELGYYWFFFDQHLGLGGGWLLMIVGLSVFAISLYRKDPLDQATLSYLVLAIAWYFMVTVSDTKNPFLGVAFYLFLYLFSWAAIAGASQRWLSKTRVGLCVVTLASGALLTVAGAAPFLVRTLDEPPPITGRNKEVLRQIALDLKGFLKPDETYTAGDYHNYSAALVRYYSISDDEVLHPENWHPYITGETAAEFIDNTVSKTSALLLWKQDMAEVSKSVLGACLPEAYEYYRALQRWANRPESPYRLVKEYTLYFSSYSATGEPREETLTLQLYLKQGPSSLSPQVNKS